MNAQFSNPRSIKLWPSVGRTYSCNSASCSNTKYVGKASSKGIKLNGSLAKKDYLYWKVDHSVGIPISKAYPNIDYWYSATAQPHSLRVRGRHDKAPSHEQFMDWPRGSRTIYTFPIEKKKDFWYLFGVKKSWSYDM